MPNAMKSAVTIWIAAALLPGATSTPRAIGQAATPGSTGSPAQFTRLVPIPTPTIVSYSADFPGGGYKVTNLIDGKVRTEYASAAFGTKTRVEFDFGQPRLIGGLRHIDRSDPATVGTSELIFTDETGRQIATASVKHVNQPGGVTSLVLSKPIEARRVRWQVTGLGPNSYATVGGAEITFFSVGQVESSPNAMIMDVAAPPVREKKGPSAVQPLRMTLDYPYANPVDVTVRIDRLTPTVVPLSFGSRSIELSIPFVESDQSVQVALDVAGRTVVERKLPLNPIRKSVIYILPHSHVDIGYTELQTDIERKQMANIAKGIALARATAGNPEGARYRWNVEVLWAVESYLRQASPEKQQEFFDAVRKGWIGLDAMYGNELTGLCRPEELVRLFSYATRLSDRCGLPIESAMISDVPGFTWGILSVMAQAGVKYWSIGPNYFDTIGTCMIEWENKPFYWISPTGREKVLCWVPYQGYAISHILRSNLTSKFILDLMTHLTQTKYPYDLIHLRWSGHGDNAPPDEKIPEFVKEWNEKYDSPKLVISTTTEALREFERRYGHTLPTYSGDWTPYWENGAASSARETAINRASAERLTQAETLWALLNPAPFPAAEFQEAWRNVLLYSEHTWGAHNSISAPDSPFVKGQWKIKQAFALDGESQSLRLLNRATRQTDPPSQTVTHVDVFNTTSWVRTDLVTVSKAQSTAGDRVTASDGKPVPSQRLSNGDLAFMAKDVPPMAAKRYAITTGEAGQEGRCTVTGTALDNGILSVRLDERTGAIAELRTEGRGVNLADANSVALNDYFFVAGTDTQNPMRAGSVKISIKESGPLVASLIAESDAPGCNRLSREVRLIAGLDRVELINVLDKKRAPARGKEAKEGVHFGFAFNVHKGVMRLDTPWAVVRPETDQLPGSCKNWFTVQRWIDVSNEAGGVTWFPIDAPMVQVGAITANLVGSQTNPKAWITHLAPSQTLYSMVMNNHWHTNYCAYQEGLTTFRYAIRPHQGYTPDEAARLGTGLSQPLMAVPAGGDVPAKSRMVVEPAGVLVTAFKPSDDGKATIVRLFGASGRDCQATLRWSEPAPRSLWLSDTSEKPIRKIEAPVDVPGFGIVTLRAD